MYIITTENLTKKYGEFTAVDSLTMNIEEGGIFGFVGPNGAGKTTSVRMLTTMSPPTSGSATVCGIDLINDYQSAKGFIGITQQHISLDRDISVKENMIHHALLHKIPLKEIGGRIRELSELMGLEEYMDRTIISLSGGWKRRVSIVCSIIHKPKILFLDEPTAGLDTQSRHMLWELIRTLNKNGTTIFLTTHYMDEVASLCNKVGIINKGKLVALGGPDELCDELGHIAVEHIDDNGRTSYRYFPNRDSAQEYIKTFSEKKDVIMRTTNLEDVFLELTGRDVKAEKTGKVIRV